MSNTYRDNRGFIYHLPKKVNEDLRISTVGIKLIQHFESCKLKAYQDSGGIWTIGWGTTRYGNGLRVKQGDTITQRKADAMFRLQLPRYEMMVKELIKIDLKQHEFDALVSFCYNAGTSYKAGDIWRPFNLWKHVNNKQSDEFIVNYWRKLAITAGGIRLNGLIRRRKSEAHLFTTGKLMFYD